MKDEVLRFFIKRKEKAYTVNKLAKRFGVSNGRMRTILWELCREGLLFSLRFGNRNLYFYSDRIKSKWELERDRYV